MSFLFPIPIWIGLALLAAPILIHLINLRRQQRIPWAAMQFLIESQRRNRSWILLKQLLLMAARIGVVALLLLLLLHLVVRNEWLSLLGRGTTHHLVLLVLEDFHWADMPTARFVATALRNLSELPIVVLALARPDVHDLFPGLWSDRDVQEIRLGELSRRACEKFVKEMLKVQ